MCESILLALLVGPGLGIEVVSQVNNIPKGSRLAVSTTLLASIITVCMRATGQMSSLAGSLTGDERRTVAARAILGEWLSGSGGGWQDSGGIWPGIKLIEGVQSAEGDIEHGVSRGCLLPRHSILGQDRVSARTREALQESLILVHGGMAQDVGPILEMVTERYLLRSEKEWRGRRQALELFDEIVAQLERAISGESGDQPIGISRVRSRRSSLGHQTSTRNRSSRILRRHSGKTSGDSGCSAGDQSNRGPGSIP